MRVLIDAAFPQTMSGPSGSHVIDRYRGRALDDSGLVHYARQHGYDLLVFLGASVLAEDRVLSAAKATGVTVAATYETMPDRAASIVKRMLPDMSRQRRHAALIVKADGVLPLAEST